MSATPAQQPSFSALVTRSSIIYRPFTVYDPVLNNLLSVLNSFEPINMLELVDESTILMSLRRAGFGCILKGGRIVAVSESAIYDIQGLSSRYPMTSYTDARTPELLYSGVPAPITMLAPSFDDARCAPVLTSVESLAAFTGSQARALAAVAPQATITSSTSVIPPQRAMPTAWVTKAAPNDIPIATTSVDKVTIAKRPATTAPPVVNGVAGAPESVKKSEEPSTAAKPPKPNGKEAEPNPKGEPPYATTKPSKANVKANAAATDGASPSTPAPQQAKPDLILLKMAEWEDFATMKQRMGEVPLQQFIKSGFDALGRVAELVSSTTEVSKSEPRQNAIRASTFLEGGLTFLQQVVTGPHDYVGTIMAAKEWLELTSSPMPAEPLNDEHACALMYVAAVFIRVKALKEQVRKAFGFDKKTQ